MARTLRLPKSFASAADFAAYLKEVDAYGALWNGAPIELPEAFSTKAGGSPLAMPFTLDGFAVGMIGAAIAAMEGWDALQSGRPSACNFRRWMRMGASGAKIIFGVEAFAIDPEARANPNQLCFNEHWSEFDLEQLATALRLAHCAAFGGMSAADDLLLLLQLTHSGRWCVPTWAGGRKPRLMYHHPALNKMFQIGFDDALLLSDDELKQLPAKYAGQHSRRRKQDSKAST